MGEFAISAAQGLIKIRLVLQPALCVLPIHIALLLQFLEHRVWHALETPVLWPGVASACVTSDTAAQMVDRVMYALLGSTRQQRALVIVRYAL